MSTQPTVAEPATAPGCAQLAADTLAEARIKAANAISEEACAGAAILVQVADGYRELGATIAANRNMQPDTGDENR